MNEFNFGVRGYRVQIPGMREGAEVRSTRVSSPEGWSPAPAKSGLQGGRVPTPSPMALGHVVSLCPLLLEVLASVVPSGEVF